MTPLPQIVQPLSNPTNKGSHPCKNLLSFGHCPFGGGGSNRCPKKFGPHLLFWTFLSKSGPKCPKNDGGAQHVWRCI